MTKEDAQILKRLADRVAKALGGTVSKETKFRFVQDNLTRYVRLHVAGLPVQIGLHMVEFSPDEGEIAVTGWDKWNDSPSELDRIDDIAGSYAPDGSQNGRIVKDLKDQVAKLEARAFEAAAEEE